jgi:hypothetical protein
MTQSGAWRLSIIALRNGLLDHLVGSHEQRLRYGSASRKALSIAGSGDTAPITATRQTLSVCCARAATGNVIAAPPSADMNCRLPISIAICPVPNVIKLLQFWDGITP